MAKTGQIVPACYTAHVTKLYIAASPSPQTCRKYKADLQPEDGAAVPREEFITMRVRKMKFRRTGLAAVAALGLGALSLGGCVVYPSGYAYNSYGYAPVYAPAYVAPPVYGSVVIGGGWGGSWGGGWHRWR